MSPTPTPEPTQTNAVVAAVTDRVVARSAATRRAYLERIEAAAKTGRKRAALGCANIAHATAAAPHADKARMVGGTAPNLAIVTAYNDMLSAHQPYERFPELIRAAARAAGGTAQVAGGVPAMCDGVTQGEAGMELSLFSRDVIAMATAIALSHQTFDAALYLGVCDKIVPGLVMGALAFGHLPAVFVPAGPMAPGLPNAEKAAVRQLYAEGRATRAELLAVEMGSYHGPGTCTFYGTANTNQMLMEVMGLHLPGSSFVNPGTRMRDALTVEATRRAMAITSAGNEYTPVGRVLDERAFVNGVVGLHATGGSTNLTIHLVAMAACAGIKLTWQDLSDLAAVVPLLARVYPNGSADVNRFHAAGGVAVMMRELLAAGLLHDDVLTVAGPGLSRYLREPTLDHHGEVLWRDVPMASADDAVLRGVARPFQATGGLRLLEGALGRAVMKTSAVADERHAIEAPARVFHTQEAVQAAFRAGELDRDVVVVVRFQGPRANGMPELHKLMPALGVLQDRGHRVALVTDGRLSGASGKVPAAIHVTPEAALGGPIARLRDGDVVRVDAVAGTLDAAVAPAAWDARRCAEWPEAGDHAAGVGRELFAAFRLGVSAADLGAAVAV